jgi:gluconokinase
VVVVIFGVSGVGKTTVGKLLADELGWKFYEADDFHPAANIEKMKHGIPLGDEDRRPWLERLRQVIERCITADENAVIACSALKRAYRDFLRVNDNVRFVFLRASRARVAERLQRRHGHFMPPRLLDSQFADLEEPGADEQALTVAIEGSAEDVAEVIKMRLSLPG